MIKKAIHKAAHRIVEKEKESKGKENFAQMMEDPTFRQLVNVVNRDGFDIDGYDNRLKAAYEATTGRVMTKQGGGWYHEDGGLVIYRHPDGEATDITEALERIKKERCERLGLPYSDRRVTA